MSKKHRVTYSRKRICIHLNKINDYDGEISSKLIEVNVSEDSKWANKSIMDSNIQEDILIVMIKRQDKVLIPKESTIIKQHLVKWCGFCSLNV